MVLTKTTKEVGAYHACCSSLEVKKQILVLLYAHHLQVKTSLKSYCEGHAKKEYHLRAMARAYELK